jgi:hypothetical protein
MSQKVLEITAEEAKYIDPKQVMSLTMVDGSTIYVKGEQGEEGFIEENQENVEEQANQQVETTQQQQPLRGLGTNLALGAAALTTAALGAAAISKAAHRPRPVMMGGPRMVGPGMGMRGPGMYGPGMRGPGMYGPGMRPGMYGPGMMMGPRFRSRKQESNNNEEQVYEETQEKCPHCNK